MPGKKQKAKVTEHEVGGHSVRIVQQPDREELWIDDTRRRFFKNEQGYVLFDKAYVPSHASLIDAVREYLSETEPPKSGKKSGRP